MDKSKLANIALLKKAVGEAKGLGVPESPIRYDEDDSNCLFAW